MFATRKSMAWSSLRCLMILGCAAGARPGVVRAVDGKLSVQAASPVLYSGQSTQVNVFAHFSGPPMPYAFASSTFDVFATDPGWNSASAGAIVGNDVLGITASQAHMPQLGTYANPSNPLRVWHGIFAPQSNAPALIEIEADPINFSVYPSKLTSSSAPCDVVGGSDYILANPLRIGRRWLAAPGESTSIQIQDDVIVDGRIITGENWDSVSVGLLPIGSYGRGSYAIRLDDASAALTPDVVSNRRTWSGPIVLNSSSTIGFSGQPVTFTATVQMLGAGDDVYQWDPGDGSDPGSSGAQRSRISSLTVTFTGLEGGGHLVGAMAAFSDGSVRPMRYNAYSGQTLVNSGVINVQNNANSPELIVSSLPKTFDAQAPNGRLYLGTETGVWRLHYDQPIVAIVRGPNGQPMPVTIDFVEIGGDSVGAPAAPIPSSNNLKQMSLGVHHFEAHGVQQMTIKPSHGY